MKLNSLSIAKPLLTLSLVIATASALKGAELRRKSAVFAAELHRAQESERRARKDASDLQALLTGHEEPLPLERTVAEVILALHRLQVENRLIIAGISPSVPIGRGTAQDLTAASTAIGKSSLRALTLEVKGTYREYSGLESFLAQLRQQPASITHLVISGNSFDLQLKVFGSLS